MALKFAGPQAFKLKPSPIQEERPSTAIYENRIADRQKVEIETGILEKGNQTQQFYSASGELIAEGYNRIVYGDHGPYIEFRSENIKCELFRKFNQPAKPDSYYEWLKPKNDDSVKVYYQLKTVENLKNPPPGGFKGNRPEGYADYQIGFIYISPWDLVIPNPNLNQTPGF